MFEQQSASMNKFFATAPNRRAGDRWHEHAGCAMSIDGFQAWLLDASEGGARARTRRNFEADQVVRIDLPWGKVVRADILECSEGVARLKFHFPVDQPL